MARYVLISILMAVAIQQAQADDDFCFQDHIFHWATSDPVEAVHIFAIQMKEAACILKSFLILKEDQSIYLLAYDLETKQFRYKLIDFAKSPPTQKICTTTSHVEPGPDGSWNGHRDVFSPPACSAETQLP